MRNLVWLVLMSSLVACQDEPPARHRAAPRQPPRATRWQRRHTTEGRNWSAFRFRLRVSMLLPREA